MSEEMWTVIGTAISALVVWILNQIRAKFAEDSVQRKVTDAILVGMTKAQGEVIRPVKVSSPGTKLDSDTIRRATETVAAEAVKVAEGKAKEVIRGMSNLEIESRVKQLLAKMRK